MEEQHEQFRQIQDAPAGLTLCANNKRPELARERTRGLSLGAPVARCNCCEYYRCHPGRDGDADDEEVYFEYFGRCKFYLNRYNCHNSYSSGRKNPYSSCGGYDGHSGDNPYEVRYRYQGKN